MPTDCRVLRTDFASPAAELADASSQLDASADELDELFDVAHSHH